MTIEEIKKEAEIFFEWPSDNKQTVTTTSAILFADFIARKERGNTQSVAAEAYQIIAYLADELNALGRKEVTDALDHFSAISCGEQPDKPSALPFHLKAVNDE